MTQPEPTGVTRPQAPFAGVACLPGLLIAVIAFLGGTFYSQSRVGMPDAAFAQMSSAGGARGVFAFSGQLTRQTYGIYMVDVDTGTIWVYEYEPSKPCMRLAAARSWQYDRYLEDFQGCDLSPDQVKELVETAREKKLEALESK